MILFLLACQRYPQVEPVQLELSLAGPIRFVALGDVGRGDRSQQQVAAGVDAVCQAEGCDFALLLGDNLYPRGLTSPTDPAMDRVFTQIYGNISVPFYAVLGNHDYGTRSPATAAHQLVWASHHDQLQLPSNYYSLKLPNASFFALDTERLFWSDDVPQVDWLREGLAQRDGGWRVVFGHHPYRSDGKHGNAGEYEGWSGLPYASGRGLRRFFEHTVVGHADLYLSAHDHSLQSFSYHGLELIVSGAGANARPLLDRGNNPDLAFSQTGFVWVELADNLTIRLYNAAGALLGERIIPRDRPSIAIQNP